MKDAKDRCPDCCWWEPDGMHEQPDDCGITFPVGFCHRYPPHSTGSLLQENGKEEDWPLTAEEDWCGEFTRASAEVLAERERQRKDRANIAALCEALWNPFDHKPRGQE